MGIFGDIGRSNAGAVGQSVFNDVMKYKQQESQDIMNTIAVANTAQTMEVQRQHLALLQAADARAAEKHQQEEAAQNLFIPATALLGSEDTWHPGKRQGIEDLKAGKVLENRGGVWGITARNVPIIKQYTEQNPDQHANWMSLGLQQGAMELGALKDKIDAERNPEKLQALTEEHHAKLQRLSNKTEQYNQVVANIPKVAEARAIAATKFTPKIVQSDESPTGWAYQDLNTGDMTEGAPPPRDYGADTLYRSKTLAETMRHNRAVESKSGAGGMGGKLDFEGAKALIKTLPKLKEEAVSASGNLQRIDTMTALLDKGLGGRMGQAKAWLAPWAEAAGIDVKGLSEAQTYELLAQTLGGSMRMAIVGPGQVSNFEQQMLTKVNAGGRAATPAARELLKYYRDIAARKVSDYNDSVDSVAEVSPGTEKLYKRITGGGVATPAAGGSVTTAEEFLQKKGLR